MKLINKYWSAFGGMFAVGIIVAILANSKHILPIESLMWIHFAMMLFHQFEEYSIPGKFKEFYNANIWNKNPITKFQLNDKGILVVNVALAWTGYFIAAIYGQKILWLTIGLAGVTIVNGIMHTLMFILLRKYNPGLITGLLMFIPFGLFLLIKIQGNTEPGNWIAGLVVFVVGTALIPLSIKMTNRKNVTAPR